MVDRCKLPGALRRAGVALCQDVGAIPVSIDQANVQDADLVDLLNTMSKVSDHHSQSRGVGILSDSKPTSFVFIMAAGPLTGNSALSPSRLKLD